MPKATPELIEKRKNEIVDACEKIYREKGFCGVTIKEISSETSFTRPAIYNYYETKDEILLDLLIREYEKWISDLEKIAENATGMGTGSLAEALADSLSEREVLLRIQNMNLYEIEINSRVERLADFKLRYKRTTEIIRDILKKSYPGTSEEWVSNVGVTFAALLLGIYPFAFHTEKQIEAMKMADMPNDESTIAELISKALRLMLPDV
ncbi:MAG: TetR family transcriptional regulator [Mogibacterium sp.]|nr:TetR family transcriptional regulator [Mogibacterium sp.]